MAPLTSRLRCSSVAGRSSPEPLERSREPPSCPAPPMRSSRVRATSRSSTSGACATRGLARACPSGSDTSGSAADGSASGSRISRVCRADAVAAVLTVTAVSRGAGWNYVTVFPAGEPIPDTSSLNLGAFDGAVANLVTIKLGAGAVDLSSFVDCDLIVDLIGVYRPTASPVSAGSTGGVLLGRSGPRHSQVGPSARRRRDLERHARRARHPRRCDRRGRNADRGDRGGARLCHGISAWQWRPRHVERERRPR